jgi:hypothetical protein
MTTPKFTPDTAHKGLPHFEADSAPASSLRLGEHTPPQA